MHLSFCKLSSCILKEGLTGEEGIWRGREREASTSVPTHDSTGMGTHDPFLSTAPVCYGFGHSCSHATNFPQSNCKQEINIFTILTKKAHLWFQITHVKPA